MIQNDTELTATRERIAYFLDLIARMRIACRPEEYASMSGGYRAEVDKMQKEVMEYLSRHVSETTAKAG